MQNESNSETDSAVLRSEAWEQIKCCDGVVVPGGFGNRGFDGKVLAAKYCREEKVPFLGICLGFQAMVVEYARNILNWKDANSTEFDENVSKPVIMFMPEIDKDNMGGTMRLGSRATRFTHTADDYSMSVSQCLYLLATEHGNGGIIWERHRHRYEVNPEFVDEIHDAGLKFVARDADSGTRMEIAELLTREHPITLDANTILSFNLEKCTLVRLLFLLDFSELIISIVSTFSIKDEHS